MKFSAKSDEKNFVLKFPFGFENLEKLKGVFQYLLFFSDI